MSAPVLWIVFPFVLGTVMLPFLNHQRIIKWIGSLSSLLLLLVAVFQPIGNVIRVGQFVIDFKPELQFLGRALVLSNEDRIVLVLLYGTLLLFISTIDRSYFPAKAIPLSILFTALLISAQAVEPFLYSAVLVEMAVLMMVPLVREKTSHLGKGILRFIIFLSLAVPFILFTGWVLGGSQASLSEGKQLTSAAVFLAIGFTFWLAVFPFHSWVPQFSAEVNPLYLSLIFNILPITILVLLKDFITNYIWLRDSLYLSPVLRNVGSIMIVTAGIWMTTEKEIKRLLAYCVLLESGFALLMLSLFADGGDQLLYQSFFPRVLSLLMIGFSLAVMSKTGMELSLTGIRGALKKFPFSSIGVLIGLFTLAGFPLFAGFPYKLETLHQVGSISTSTVLWIAVGLAGMLFGLLRIFISLTYPGNEKWEIHETIVQAIFISGGSLILIVLGWFPGIIAYLVSALR